MEGISTFITACSLLTLLSQIITSKAASEFQWSYSGETGPRFWKKMYPECEGKYQSPINIEKTREKKNMPHLRFKQYERKLSKPEVINDGHTLKLLASDVEATISGGCLDGVYQFHHLHFHWGSSNDQGSEHTLKGKAFAMEMHLVHVNTKYDNIKEALLHGDGLAVLGVFYQVRGFNNSALDPVVQGASSIKYLNRPVEIENEFLTLESLLPIEQNRFYCYKNGSLTTPDCSTAVTFTILSALEHIGQKQIEVFRRLRTGNNISSNFLVDNFRPIQETNKRKIFFHNCFEVLEPRMISYVILLLLQTLPKFL